MLVLSRRERDAIVIGHDIVVTVLSVGRDQIRLGISAPRDVEVHRAEVYQAIQEANRSSAAGTDALAALAAFTGADAPVSGEPATPDAPARSRAQAPSPAALAARPRRGAGRPARPA